MDLQQQAFLEHVGSLIPKLFAAISQGNVKSEYVLGDRIIGRRQVRLKLVAEVVDPGSNPLATHSQMRNVDAASNAGGSKQVDKLVGPRRGRGVKILCQSNAGLFESWKGLSFDKPAA